ncbi:4'-phosphopantetheinyl transferase family protein [Mucilaginibacter sp. E4BP6]|uniref:4'-phosphopantetheinyl transferase family protein n=1 Tax=Mucilaginibacter sp. E4BP6 TaxID=2723089 RepID=UPI0015C6EDA7|nr:4'-phosphopantetheinyl transferase superfamily protein [Mucilaginibacter sp. E4BP6]NYE68289.1 4'-phosphopantetheinyl transferase [Mucilaginibacter sp. E4BP6]
MITIIFSYLDVGTCSFDDAKALFPECICKEFNHLKRGQAANATLMGKILLAAGLQQLNFSMSEMDNYRRTLQGRPYLNGSSLDFNISHSGNLVAIALSDTNRVGLDLEEKKWVQLSDFDMVFTSEELSFINDDLDNFYDYWTVKEAAMKADGRGFGLHPKEIKISSKVKEVLIDAKKWFYRPFEVDSNFALNLVTNLDWCFEDVKIAFMDKFQVNKSSTVLLSNLIWL